MKNFMRSLREKAHSASTETASHTVADSTDLAKNTFSYFYSSKNNQFQGRVKSESTLGENDHYGYVVWVRWRSMIITLISKKKLTLRQPVVIMVQAAAECLPPAMIKQSIECLQAYWNPQRHGFCAWKMFPGNEDIYYDDNAHAAQSLISTFQATGDGRFLRQAKDILINLILPSAQHNGGVPWHINNQNCRNACSCGPAAVAALRICAIEHNEVLIAFAQRALAFMIETFRDPEDGLIWDSLVYKDDGSVEINKMKWTYNTGFAIHGFTLLYELTQRPEHLDCATRLAKAAMNPDGALKDKSIPNPTQRMYSDGSFFIHHLLDGYFALAKHTMTDRLYDEIHRVAAFGREFMLDPSDKLYFRGSVPSTISDKLTRKFNGKYGLDRQLEKNNQERDENGQLCKTLIGNAGWARIFHLAESHNS